MNIGGLGLDMQENTVQEESSFGLKEDFDLSQLLKVVWRERISLVSIVLIFLLGAGVVAYLMPNKYKATAILVPASNSSTSMLSKFAGQFGGLGSIAGVDFGGGEVDKSEMAIELLVTWGFLEAFIERNDLKVEVYAAKGWNKSDNKLLIDQSLYDSERSLWTLDEKDGERSAEPSSWELYEEIKKCISVSKDKKTGFISLSVEHYSPHVAKKWVDLLVKDINKHIQEQDKLEAQDSIKYLKEQVERTSMAEMRTIFYQLIEEQTKTLMLAEISKEYVLKTLSEAKVPEEKSKPKRLVIVLLGAFLGCGFAFLFLLFKYGYRKSA